MDNFKQKGVVRFGTVYVEFLKVGESVYLQWYIVGRVWEAFPSGDNIVTMDILVTDWDNFSTLPISVQKDFIEVDDLLEKWGKQNPSVFMLGRLPNTCRTTEPLGLREIETKTYVSGDNLITLMWSGKKAQVTHIKWTPHSTVAAIFRTQEEMLRSLHADSLTEICKAITEFIEKFGLIFEGTNNEGA